MLFIPVSYCGVDSTEALQKECPEEPICVYIYKMILWMMWALTLTLWRYHSLIHSGSVES